MKKYERMLAKKAKKSKKKAKKKRTSKQAKRRQGEGETMKIKSEEMRLGQAYSRPPP